MNELEIVTQMLKEAAAKTFAEAVDMENSFERVSAMGKAIGLQDAIHLIVCHRLEMLDRVRPTRAH